MVGLSLFSKEIEFHSPRANWVSMDNKLNIKWPKNNCNISKKDKALKSFEEFCKTHKFL